MLIKYCTRNLQIIFVADLMKVVTSGPIGDKLHETILLTIAAMTNKLGKYNKAADAEVRYGFENFFLTDPVASFYNILKNKFSAYLHKGRKVHWR